jgi:hypothetical protein
VTANDFCPHLLISLQCLTSFYLTCLRQSLTPIGDFFVAFFFLALEFELRALHLLHHSLQPFCFSYFFGYSLTFWVG